MADSWIRDFRIPDSNFRYRTARWCHLYQGYTILHTRFFYVRILAQNRALYTPRAVTVCTRGGSIVFRRVHFESTIRKFRRKVWKNYRSSNSQASTNHQAHRTVCQLIRKILVRAWRDNKYIGIFLRRFPQDSIQNPLCRRSRRSKGEGPTVRCENTSSQAASLANISADQINDLKELRYYCLL